MTFAALLCACGDNGGRGDESATGTTTGVASLTTTTTTVGTTGASASESGGVTEGGSQSESASGSSSAGMTGSSGGMTKFDLGVVPDASAGCGGGGGGNEPDFSYIWIANSSEGTISKINTQTLVEEGRYIVRPDQAGSPSRTSVNLSGDVAVANRNGGLTKVYARPERCIESNGMPGIQTSTNGTYLPWGVEECVAWHTPMNYPSQRPAAWTQGNFNKGTCLYENQKVWTSGNPSGNGTVEVLRVNGDNGTIENNVMVPVNPDFYGIYGAAVDKNGSFWGSQLGVGVLVHIDAQTLQVKTWPMPTDGYGMTVDSMGYVWTCSYNAARFDPMTEQWQTVQAGEYGGCMEDGKGTLYKATPGGIVGIDIQTLTVKQTYTLPEHIHGISIDFYGFVWAVGMTTSAYRVDPMSAQYQTFSGLVGPYTYSDMTGFALSNVGMPTG